MIDQRILRRHLAVRHRDIRSIAVISSDDSATTRRDKVDLSRARDERSVSLADVGVSDAASTDEWLIDRSVSPVCPSVRPCQIIPSSTHELSPFCFVIADVHWSMFVTRMLHCTLASPLLTRPRQNWSSLMIITAVLRVDRVHRLRRKVAHCQQVCVHLLDDETLAKSSSRHR